MFDKCEHCPAKNCESECRAQHFNDKNLCRKIDPNDILYNKSFVYILYDYACKENTYKPDGIKLNPSELNNHQMPSLIEMAKNFTSTMIDYAKDGFNNVSEGEYNHRLAICESCEFLDKNSFRCSQCGCQMKIKAHLAVAECPIKKWLKVDKNIPTSGCGCRGIS